MRLIACLGSALVLACTSTAFADLPSGPRGAVLVQRPPVIPGGLEVYVEIEGRTINPEAMGTPLPIAAGKRFVRTYVKDAQGKMAEPTHDQFIGVMPGLISEVRIPGAVMSTRGGLLGGGVFVATLGLGFIITSGVLFSFADGAGTDCHTGGFATGVCGDDPAPYLGFGVTTLLFGIAGLIGGPVMIAEGAKKSISWINPTPVFQPQMGPGIFGGRLTWQF